VRSSRWKYQVEFFGILMAFIFCFHPAIADEICMKNGDRITGTVVSAKEGKLTLETSYAGNITIKMEEIESIETESTLTLRFQEDETVLKGKLTTEDGKLQLLPCTEADATCIPMQRIRTINLPDTLWSGSVCLGGTHQAGNTERLSVSFGAEATRRSLKGRFSLSFLYNYAEEDNELTTRNTYGTLKEDYFFTDKFYGLLSIEALQDKFKDLNLRTVVGPGLGYQVWEDDAKSLLFEAGVAYYSENRIDAEDDEWLTARLATNISYKLAPWITVSDSFIWYPQLETFGEYTLRNEAAMVTSLYGSWSLRLANLWERDSNPGVDVKYDDIKSTLSLQYSF